MFSIDMRCLGTLYASTRMRKVELLGSVLYPIGLIGGHVMLRLILPGMHSRSSSATSVIHHDWLFDGLRSLLSLERGHT